MLKNNLMSSRGISTKEYEFYEKELSLLENEAPIPNIEKLENLNLFVTPQHKRREIFFYEIYKLILDKPGCIGQFGVRWGRDLALFESYRTIFEPFNHSRKIIGFDTFEGYSGITKKDGRTKQLYNGNLQVSKNYLNYLQKLLEIREKLSPLSQINKFKLIKGNIEKTLKPYLKNNPHEIYSLIHLDLNLYKPTKFVIKNIKDRLFSGSIIIIDEVNLHKIPGETIAIMEEFGLNNLKLRRLPYISPTWPCYFEVE